MDRPQYYRNNTGNINECYNNAHLLWAKELFKITHYVVYFDIMIINMRKS
mgnify:CR=1 FL=1